ncbi:MAG TPA: TonB family protein [Thermoanaerobaculia bacterium]|nr:TonB family protein [Thermoanaerobaculia bacterium]
MPENILVVEYEPRYTDRVQQALAGQPLTLSFARDGEEAIRTLDAQPPPKLIVVSSVVPKIAMPELVRMIRSRPSLRDTPILLTVSGYSGKSPKTDAQRVGASDILPKPYSEAELLGKIQQMLGIRSDAAAWPPTLGAELAPGGSQMTSSEIFGDLLEDDKAPVTGARKAMKSSDDLDKMLAATLAGVMPQKKKDAAGAPGEQRPPAAEAKPKPAGGTSEFDKKLQDTLSGLERTTRARPQATPAPQTPQPAATPISRPAVPPPAPQTPVSRPAAPPPPVATPVATAPSVPLPAASPTYKTDRIPTLVQEKVPVSQPILSNPAPEAARDDRDDSVEGVRFGQYLLVEKIATGGMAEVWKARMRGVEGFQKIVAIKKILPHLSDNRDFIEMFVDEAKLAAQLNHNNIIHIYDLGKIQSSYYIAMEYIDGHDLKTILRRGEERDQPMSIELALFIASKIASALDYAHRKHDFEDRDLGLVHRDISPQNVLISQEGDIKLCDFGIAKAASKASHTQAGALKGKLQYMSPEQAWGRNIDKRSDIFALATVLFEMLTGRKLFSGDNELSILEQVREARVLPPSQFNEDVSPEIDTIVQKALEKEPDRRYQTAGELARDLDAVLYTFKPTPTSADLAIYMHRIWSADTLMQPLPEIETVVASGPVAVPLAPTAPGITPLPAAAVAEHAPLVVPPAAEKKSPAGMIGIAAGVIIVLGVGGYFGYRSFSGPSAPAARTGTAKPGTTAASANTAAASTLTGSATSTALTGTAGGTQAPVLDQAKVDEEFRKRLAAEKAKFDQQHPTLNATQPGTATATSPRPAPSPVPVPAAPAPASVTELRPTPVPQPPVPQPAETRPAPQPAPAEPVARTRPGELIAAGTEGLVAAHMTRRAEVPYPPLAKRLRVEGTVILSALVSENGQVLDVRVIKGVDKPVGLNEAAAEAVRKSTFAPPTKDGVPVRAWTTVPIVFKL